jgi:hypothetical protein
MPSLYDWAFANPGVFSAAYRHHIIQHAIGGSSLLLPIADALKSATYLHADIRGLVIHLGTGPNNPYFA